MILRTLALCAALSALPLTAWSTPGADLVGEVFEQTQGDREQRIQQLKNLLKSAPSSVAPLIELYLAEQHRLLDEQRPAKRLFRSVSRSSSALSRGGELGLVVLDGLHDLDDEGMALLRSVSEADLPDSLNAERHLLLAAVAAKANQAGPAGEHSRQALLFAASDPSVDRDVRRRLQRLLEGELPPLEPEPVDHVAAIERALAEGDADKVSLLADQLRSMVEPGSDLSLYLDYLTPRMGAAPLNPKLVGVLLPMSGKYRGVGAQIKTAIEKGIEDVGPGIKLQFVDTMDGEDATVKQLEELVLKRGVGMVVGPLRSELAEPVSAAAEALRVPMIGLHQDSTASANRDFVSDGIATPRAQIRALLDYVFEDRAFERFAIFAPDTPYGNAAADLFAEEVKERGGEIMVREHYAADEADLIPYAKALGRKDYEARRAEFRELKREIEEKGGDPKRAVLPPVIDYDAIFLPDNHRRIPVAAAGLAYEEFSIGQFKLDKEVDPLPLLGLSGWNNAELVTSGGPYVRDSVFVDVWLPSSPAAESFSRRYEAQTRRKPNSLEAQAFTVGRILAALGKVQVEDRTELLEALRTLEGEPSATGGRRISLAEDRVDHLLRILTLDNEGIREIERVRVPPPSDP
ncbi:MAG: hypothetical protein EA397_07380 [Deltaproteobacteria bacterium]|nr:MAG: hypothetical protein EA397_07380 [Deltaproteobacteria bacterium]